jgi:muramoyltetrapeptide carboxypeptidase
MAILPPYLSTGDTIGIVCPSGFMPFEKAKTCISVLQQWGFKVKTGPTLGNQFHYFSGTDEERLHDLQLMLDDKEVKAILCGRGGYGLTRIIDKVNFKQFRKHPKWIIGYSDITLLLCHVYSRLNIASLHSPMAAAFNDDEYKSDYVQSLRKAITGKKYRLNCPPHDYNQTGNASGELVGGNLALLAHIVGTPSDIKTKGKILFIEDVGEYVYNADRMLQQLKRSGKLEKLAGLVVGGFSDMKDTTIPFGKDIYEVVKQLIQEYDYPVCFQFPVGHARENYALKVGVSYSLKVTKKKVLLQEE